MRDRTILVWGAGGHAAVVADAALAAGARLAGFVSDDAATLGRPVDGFDAKVVALDADLRAAIEKGTALPGGADAIVLGVGANSARIAIAARIPEALLPPVVHPSAVIGRGVTIGAGTVVLALAAVNPRARIGRAAIVNTAAVIEHDCVIGDGAHVSPGAVLAGAASVGDAAWVGAGAVLFPGVRVESGAIVGAGAVATRDVAPGAIVKGTPARADSA